jgi:hypothetical protein
MANEPDGSAAFRLDPNQFGRAHPLKPVRRAGLQTITEAIIFLF